MPKHKKKDESSDSDSGPEDRGPAKKAKPAASKADEDEPSWSLDKRRQLKVREFKGKVYIDIREYYEVDGDLKPGKKGIALSPAQWTKLKDIMEEVDECIKKKC